MEHSQKYQIWSGPNTKFLKTKYQIQYFVFGPDQIWSLDRSQNSSVPVLYFLTPPRHLLSTTISYSTHKKMSSATSRGKNYTEQESLGLLVLVGHVLPKKLSYALSFFPEVSVQLNLPRFIKMGGEKDET